MYRGGAAIPDAASFAAALAQSGCAYVFFTNCAERTPAELAAKLGNMGINVPAARIVNAGMAAASYVRAEWPAAQMVYAVGSASFKQMLRESYGFTVLEDAAETADVVIVSHSSKITYNELMLACRHVLRGARLLAANGDATIPTPEGEVPHTGASVAFIECATGATAVTAGKPEAYAFRFMAGFLGAAPADIRVVGDRLDTDMAFAKRNGAVGYLMLTGCTSASQAEAARGQYDEAFASLTSLVACV